MRYPAVAGRFYPLERENLLYSIERCFEHELGPGLPGGAGSSRRILGAMSPHAGYMCSGMVAAHTYKAIKEDGLPEAYVVIGPDHYGLSPGITMCTDGYLTPLGECPCPMEIAEKLSGKVPDIPMAHAKEHSVEVEVPFIQYIDPDAKVLPIVMGDQSLHAARLLADALKDACRGHDVVVIASTDMSHYIPKKAAERLDGMALDRVAAMDAEGLYRTVRENRITMCGYGPTVTAMLFADGAEARVLKHADSYDSLGMDSDAVVGYASAVFSL